MSRYLFSKYFLSSALASTFALIACSEAGPSATPGTAGAPASVAGASGSVAGATSVAGMSGASGAGTSGAVGTAGAGGVASTAGTGGGGVNSAAGQSADAGGPSLPTAGAGTGGGSGMMSAGCQMAPQATDSDTNWIKHDIEVTGVDPAFVAKYPVNAGKTYSWTHRNYFLRLPKEYDPAKSYPVTIGGSGCGGPDTVGSEGGYSPLGVKAGEKEAIQVSLSYVLSSAANDDCGGAVFADNFVNSPEPAYLAAVVKEVTARYCVDPSKVFLSGYSSGAFEAVTLGCANSDILRGIGIQIGGGLREHAPMPCKGPVAAMFVVGLMDTANPIGPLTTPLNDSRGSAPARDEVLKRNQCVGDAHVPWDPAFPMCETYTGCPKKYPVVWCAIDSGHLPDQADAAVGKYRYDGVWKFWSTLP